MAGTLVIDTLTDGSGNSTSATAAIRGSAKAWVNWNGSGVASIRASYNVSSVTRNGTGDYTVNFTNAISDTNYCVAMSSGQQNSSWGLCTYAPTANSPVATTYFRMNTISTSGTGTDNLYVNVAVFR